MSSSQLTFRYLTGIKKEIFRSVRLRGNWNALGQKSDDWCTVPMNPIIGEDGCPAFELKLDYSLVAGEEYRWGVELDGPAGSHLWGIVTEIPDPHLTDRYRSFIVGNDDQQVEIYYFTMGRRLGANKYWGEEGASPLLIFRVWAPNALNIDVVFADKNGYISDTGEGIDVNRFDIPLQKGKDGIWQSEFIAGFENYKGLFYMYRIEVEEGVFRYKTDIFSRSQAGKGNIDPAKQHWDGKLETLDGGVSSSVIIDPDIVRETLFSPASSSPVYLSAEEFWASEHDFARPVPSTVDDLIIYELHIGALGFHREGPGVIEDAIALLDQLSELGVNCIELLPMAEFSGNAGWGYGDTHHFVIESSSGGRDQYRHFIRECHRRGIAVIQDVVYNHYDPNAGRAQWQYDAQLPEQNIYYWYEGKSTAYPGRPDGGYLDNGSSGWTPNFREDVVRQQFISSAAFLIEEMHVDGLRVDLTQAIHRDNVLHYNGWPVSAANLMGQKLLREWSRTLKLIHPSVMLIAEDHTGWDAVTKLPAAGGLGFDATWYADFYHSLIGDADSSGGKARLLKEAGYGDDRQLAIDQFAAVLWNSQYKKVVYQESHDEAGNAGGSARTACTAVNNAPLVGNTRKWAEKRSRVVSGISILSAGIPMFFMGEEIVAQKPYKYNDFLMHKEDLAGERSGEGAKMFRFYQDLIMLSKRFPAIRGKNIDILQADNGKRIMAFKRWRENEQLLVVASFSNLSHYQHTLRVDSYRLPDGNWKEVFNSDSLTYGGDNTGNAGAGLKCTNGCVVLTVPGNAVLVFVKQ